MRRRRWRYVVSMQSPAASFTSNGDANEKVALYGRVLNLNVSGLSGNDKYSRTSFIDRVFYNLFYNSKDHKTFRCHHLKCEAQLERATKKTFETNTHIYDGWQRDLWYPGCCPTQSVEDSKYQTINSTNRIVSGATTSMYNDTVLGRFASFELMFWQLSNRRVAPSSFAARGYES